TAGMQYDTVGSRTSIPVNIPGSTAGTGTTAFQYNSSSELTQEQSTRNGSYTETFGYDAAFNPTTWKGVGQTFNSDNQNSANGYDGNGNPTSYGGSTLSFDPENRLTSFGSVLTAGYTGDNLRAWKQNLAGRTYFLYDGRLPVAELDGSGAVSAVNTFGANGLLSRHTSAGSVFYTFGPEGSVAQRLDSTQAVLSTMVYDGFGSKLSGGATGEPWGHGAQAGYVTDNETGLQLLTRRYYDPSAGRFLNRDPISYRGGVNLYGYVGNNPATWDDPPGTDTPPWKKVLHTVACLLGMLRGAAKVPVYKPGGQEQRPPSVQEPGGGSPPPPPPGGGGVDGKDGHGDGNPPPGDGGGGAPPGDEGGGPAPAPGNGAPEGGAGADTGGGVGGGEGAGGAATGGEAEGAGELGGDAAGGPVAILIAGGDAGIELITYEPGYPSGPLTQLGTDIGNYIGGEIYGD
ncbi:MAG TPA: RHS repeat-associated core domain-containing protein, partial [Chloroflexota bacterium]|nr:RHS repeat-associated core domain-containing protein [Chloroflexota bacterium]